MAATDDLLGAVQDLTGAVTQVKRDRAEDKRKNRILAISVILDIMLSVLLYASNADITSNQSGVRQNTCDNASLWLVILGSAKPSGDVVTQGLIDTYTRKYMHASTAAHCGHPYHPFNWVQAGFFVSIGALVALVLWWLEPWTLLRRRRT